MQMTIDKSDSTPAYQQLKELLIEMINSGQLQPGSKLPSENALSKSYGIHRHTVRVALKHLAGENWIRSVPGRGWFINNNSNLTNTENTRPVIEEPLTLAFYGITTENIHSQFSTSFLNALIQQSNACHTTLQILSRDDLLLLKSDAGYRKQFNALIWAFPRAEDIAAIEELNSADLAVIVANRQVFGADIPYIAVDQYAGTRELVTRLTRAGHRKIACITSDAPYRYVSERYRGYCDAIHGAGLEVDKSLVLHIHDIKTFPQQLSTFMTANSNISAIFLAGEIFHETTLNFLHQKKYRIPDDVSIVAFDRLNLSNEKLKITCLEQPVEQLAKELLNTVKQLNSAHSRLSSKILNPILIQGNSIKNIAYCTSTKVEQAIAV